MRTIVPINAVLQEVSTSENAASVRELRNERVSENFFSQLGAVQARSFERRTRTSREFSKENSKLNETRYFSGSFKLSLKCGIAGSVNFRKYRISARASQRARKRKFFLATRRGTSAKFRAAHTYIREFSKENSKLNERRYFSGSFKASRLSAMFLKRFALSGGGSLLRSAIL